MKYGNGAVRQTAVIVAVLAIYTIIDRHLRELPGIVRWVVFLPFETAKWLADIGGLPQDHGILFAIITGTPVLVLYWAGVLRWILKRVSQGQP